MEANRYAPLFMPLTVRGKTYKNRIAAAPLGNVSISPDGSYPASSFVWYEKRAKGGCGEIMVSETPVDYEYANRLAAAEIDYTDLGSPHFQSLQEYARMLHSYGVIATVELNHCGANRFSSAGKKAPIGPSGYIRSDGVCVTEMDEGLMVLTAAHFAQAAYYFQQAGFDGVVPHMGSGWLLQQFLSPLTNHRQDEYGGGVENRVRFPIRVLQAIRERCGEELLIIPRFCADEGVPGGYGADEGAEMARLLEPWIDMLHLVRGVYYEPVRSGEYSSMFAPHAPNAALSERLKRAVKVPVVLSGGISDPAEAAELIRSGKADMIALGRQMLADPDWAVKTEMGQAEDIAKCLRCFRCFPGPLQDTGGKPLKPPDKKCTVNPTADLNELQPPVENWPEPQKSRQVLVVGGGVAGMTAAATAAARGHRVTLLEQRTRLGGHINSMEADPYKGGFCDFARMLENRCRRAGVEIRTGVSVTPELLAQQQAEAVLIAVGSTLISGVIPGSEEALQAAKIGDQLPTSARDAVIIGGGLVGCETALLLAEQGIRVRILEMQKEIARDANPMHRVALLDKMKQADITVTVNAVCSRVSAHQVWYTDDCGTQTQLETELVLMALGVRPDRASAEALAAVAPEGATVTLIGDCVGAGKIQTAAEQGYLAAMKII